MKKLFLSVLAPLVAAAALAVAAPADADTNDAMAERGCRLLESAAALVDADRGKCDKMGDDLSGFIDARSGDIAALRSWGMSLSPAERRELVAKYRARFQAAEGRLRSGITPCAANPKVRGALAKVGFGG
jgi:hypothetical protein